MTLQNALGGLALEEGHLAQIAARAAQLASDATAQAILAQLTAMENPTGTALTVSGTRDRFRDGFTGGSPAQPVDPAVWTLVNESPDTGNGQGHLVLPGGDSQGAAYLRVSLSPFAAGTSVHLVSKAAFSVPIRHAWGISMSQRLTGQEVIFGLAEALDAAPMGLNRTAQPGDLPIVGTVTTNGTLQTMTVTGHGLKGNDRVIVVGNAEKRLDVGPVYVTVVDANTITVPNTLAAATYAAGGVVRLADPSANVNNCAFQLWGDNGTITNASYVARRNGTKPRVIFAQTAASSAPTQNNSNPYSDAWQATGPAEIWANIDEVVWRSWTDGTGGMAGYAKFQQSIPDETLSYRLYARAKNLDNLSRPVARITSIAKTGTTTATVGTDVPHGLAAGDQVTVTGIRDTANFPTASNAVLAVTNATTFTVNVGAAVTATDTNGGVLYLNRGGVTAPGLVTNGTLQSIVSTIAGVLVATVQAAPANVAIGDLVNLYGLLPAAAAYEGAYRVLRINGSTLELAPVTTSWSGATFGSINTGGQAIRRTDVRLHFARMLGHTRLMTEVIGGRANTADSNNAVPVTVAGFGPAISLNAGGQVNPQLIVAEGAPATSTALGVSSTFTQTAIDQGATTQTRATRIRVNVLHTAGVTPGLLALEESVDNLTFRRTWQAPVPSDGAYHTFDVSLRHRYFRWVFVNGVTAQTALWLSYITVHGDGAIEENKNLLFPLTVGAGQAAAISAVTTFPTLDLGPNHSWDTVRTMISSDQAGTAVIQQSQDNTNWVTAGAGAVTLVAATPQVIDMPIWGRYLRVVHTNNATTAATALRLAQSLKSL